MVLMSLKKNLYGLDMHFKVNQFHTFNRFIFACNLFGILNSIDDGILSKFIINGSSIKYDS